MRDVVGDGWVASLYYELNGMGDLRWGPWGKRKQISHGSIFFLVSEWQKTSLLPAAPPPPPSLKQKKKMKFSKGFGVLINRNIYFFLS